MVIGVGTAVVSPRANVVSAKPASADASAPKAESRAAFCGNCGTPAESDSVFCGSCGTKL